MKMSETAHTVYPKKYAHGFCFAVLCCGYTLTDFPISNRLTSLALWQSNDCPSASKATLMNMDKYFMWIHYERLRNHNKAKHNKTVCIFLGIYCNASYSTDMDALKFQLGQYDTVYPKKYAHGFVVLCFVVVTQSFIMNSHEVFIHIHQGCFAGTGAIVRLPQCQWSKPDGYGKISQCITTTKHSKAKTVCIFLGIYCTFYNGQIQQGVSECPMMLIKVINTGSVPYCGSNDNNNFTGVSLSDILFSFMYQNILSAMYVDWDIWV